MKIRSKIIGLVSIFTVGFASFWAVSQSTLNFSGVGGPVFDQLIEGEHLVADILPPPLFIIEARVTSMELAMQPDPVKRQLLVEKAQ